MTTTIRTIPQPYLLFLGDITERLGAKTALGVLEWRPEACVGQFRLPGATVDLGLADCDPVAAKARGARTMVIGGASFGGVLPDAWIAGIEQAIDAGLNIASGLHERLNARPALVARAERAGVELFDVRALPPGFAVRVGTGARRSGMRLLTVGTDCAVGKKFTTLTIEREFRQRGVPCTFRATGQTGVLISGAGVAIDAVVADFLTGVVESLSPDNAPDHWDVIEGQGSIMHPAYAPVSLGLLHGSQPDAVVACHAMGRDHLIGYPDRPVPALPDLIADTLHWAKLTNPGTRCVGISLNTLGAEPAAAAAEKARISSALGLPCVDPAIDGAAAIVDRIVQDFALA